MIAPSITQTTCPTKRVDDKIVNGVNVKKLLETRDAVRHNQQIARFNFRAKSKWIDGAHSSTTINDFYGACQTHSRSKPFVFEKDEPPILLGNDQGANPIEYILVALAGCLIASLVYHAAARRIKIDEVEATLAGDADLRGPLGMDANVRNGYEKIEVIFRIKADAPEEKLKELVELAQRRSPVFDIISNPTPVQVSLATD